MKPKKKTIRCPYCGGTAVLRDAAYVYGTNPHGEQLYVCQHYPSCDAYVGVHKGTQTPKGTLADGDLRNLRIRAHRMFDMIWKNGILTRKNAYRWIQDKFSLRSDQAHIGNFSEYKSISAQLRAFTDKNRCSTAWFSFAAAYVCHASNRMRHGRQVTIRDSRT